ncbi:MAG: hypothetical protein OEY20_13355 [Gemmatimonadota bacterium]|nr:hypothetical protein [Gemmatimonadota bacterium]MDH4351274.1 hypothetical protein [Gemmatimonadota bacterium]MDH5198224.1 hypothetical protein [Gemmatimonadota bacterium]
MTLVRFLHVLGIALWLGAGVVALLFATGAKQDTPMRLPRMLLLGRIYSFVIAPGAMLATASGIALTMMAASAGYGADLGAPALAAMQALGLLAGVLEIFVAFPTAQRLTGAAAASVDGAAWAGERMRARLVALLAVTLTLVVVSTYLGLLG